MTGGWGERGVGKREGEESGEEGEVVDCAIQFGR